MAESFRIVGLPPVVPPEDDPANLPTGVLSPLLMFLRDTREVGNGIMRGKMNVTLDVTLAPNAASTTVNDARIGGGSYIGLNMPLTANAAAERGNGTVYVSSRGNQVAVIAHANSAQTDRKFRVAIIG